MAYPGEDYDNDVRAGRGRGRGRVEGGGLRLGLVSVTSPLRLSTGRLRPVRLLQRL